MPAQVGMKGFVDVLGLSDQTRAGRFFLALNAQRASTGTVDVIHRPFPMLSNMVVDALLWQNFAFRPDSIVLRSVKSVYTKTVRGNGIPLSAIWFEDSTSNKTAYADNFTGNSPTQFRIDLQRISPEFVWKKAGSKSILSDSLIQSGQSFARESIDVRSLWFGKEVKRSVNRVLLNRAIQPLHYRIMMIEGDTAQWRMTLTQSQAGMRPFVLGRSTFEGTVTQNDSLQIEFAYTPQSTGGATARFRVYCNDSTLAFDAVAKDHYMEIVVQGRAVAYTISYNDSVAFGNVRLRQASSASITMTNRSGRTISIIGAMTNNQQFSCTVAPQNLANNQSLIVPITFLPTDVAVTQARCAIVLADGTEIPVFVSGVGMNAQSRIRYPRLNARQDSADFGNLPLSLAGPITRADTIWVVNTANVPLQVVTTIVNENNPVSGLFTVSSGAGILQANDSLPIRIQFTSANDIRINTARVGIVVQEANTGVAVENRTIVVFGRSSALAVQPQVPMLIFDSLYVGTETTRILRFFNQSTFAIPIDAVRIVKANPSSQTLWSVEGELPIVPTLGFAEIRIRARAGWLGRDTARLVVQYRSGTVVDSTITMMTLVGIEQRLTWNTAFPDVGGDRSTVRFIRGISTTATQTTVADTVDVGTVRFGTTRRVNVVLDNVGNIPLRLRSQVLRPITPFAAEQFDIVQQPLSRQPGGTLLPSASDTSFAVRFAPRLGGEHRVEYVVESDAEDRFTNAPKIERRIVFRGSANVPTLSYTSLLSQGIIGTNRRCKLAPIQFSVLNPSNVSVSIRSIALVNNTGEFRLLSSAPGIVEPQSSATIQVEMIPQQIIQPRSIETTVLMLTDAVSPYDSVRVRITAEFAPLADSVVIEPRDTVRVRPGNRVVLPVYWRFPTQGDPRVLTQATLSFAYNPNVIQLVAINSQSTAIENIEGINFNESIVSPQVAQGVLRLSSTPSRGFLRRDTLCLLVFQTYLAGVASTPVTWRSGSIASLACEDALSIGSPRSGLIVLDSVADLNRLTEVVAKKRLRIQSISPNPSGRDISLRVVDEEIGSKDPMRICIYNLFGTKVYEGFVQSSGGHEQDIPLSAPTLQAGMYTIVMQKSSRTTSHKWIIIE